MYVDIRPISSHENCSYMNS